MKRITLAFCALALTSALISACSTGSGVSNIPHIVLTAMSADSIVAGADTLYIQFSIIDGDGDIGATTTDTSSAIYFEDSRFDTGYFENQFPIVDPSVEISSKGLQGTCTFAPFPPPIPRSDTNHAKHGDTLYYRIFITDRAKHHSDTITTPQVIVRP